MEENKFDYNKQMRPCSKNSLYNNWMNNEIGIVDTTIPSMSFERNIFDCGEYFFDGIFNVIRFPKGMQVYHGSSILANGVIEFPVGIDYYNDIKINDKKYRQKDLSIIGTTTEEIEEIISNNYAISPSWYGDVDTAQMYSITSSDKFTKIISDRYVMAYELKEDSLLSVR